MTLAIAVAFIVIAIIDPNAGGPEGNVGPSGPSPQDKAYAVGFGTRSAITPANSTNSVTDRRSSTPVS